MSKFEDKPRISIIHLFFRNVGKTKAMVSGCSCEPSKETTYMPKNRERSQILGSSLGFMPLWEYTAAG
jgi:hypothetical protein